MFSTSDTIVAIATPPGRGGIGVVRLSGAKAREVASAILTTIEPLAPRHATFTYVRSQTKDAHSPVVSDVSHSSVNSGRPAAFAEGFGVPGGSARARSPELAEGRTLERVDQVVATYFQRPASYTGEDVVEISAHGSPVILRRILALTMEAGARLAEPGEFTLRAFLNGRLDLVQAEAVADLIDAVTPLQARAAFDQLEGTLTGEIREIDAALFDVVARFEASLDFPEEGYHFVEPGAAATEIASIEAHVARLLGDAARGRLIREGAQVAISGKPNVGKSSLFNALVGTGRAIVTPIPGTTRDFITELTDIDSMAITLIDTAGDRVHLDPELAEGPKGGPQPHLDEVERAGIERARSARSVADLVLLVLDRSRPPDDDDRKLLEETREGRRVIVVNKIDLPEAWETRDLLRAAPGPIVPISVETGQGLDQLRAEIVRRLGNGADTPHETAAVTNVRHIELLRRARAALCRARQAVDASRGTLSEEFVLADLQEARNALEEITGKRTADDLLAHIFGRFCIGK